MKKRLLSALLALCMVLTMVPAAFATEGDSSGNSDVSAQVATNLPAADANGVITLQQDVTLASTYTVEGNTTVTIDLNGFTLSVNRLDSNTDLTIRDSSTDRNGVLTSSQNITCVVWDGHSITLESGSIQNTNESGTTIFNLGTFTMNDGVVSGDTVVYNTAKNGDNPAEGNIECNINGEVQEVEQKIVGRVFSLGDRTVDSIMTHRSEIVWIDLSMSADRIRELVDGSPHNRFPVADGNLDRVEGVVYLKDLFTHINDPDFAVRKVLRPAKFFHEETEVYNALEQLRTEHLGYGIVCDEFGITQGIVTLRDILEALVGTMLEEREEPDIVPREDGSALVDGQCPFYDFLAYYGLEDVLPHNEYNTLSGLILDELEHIPQTGEQLQWQMFRFEIVDMDGARIDKILVTRLS